MLFHDFAPAYLTDFKPFSGILSKKVLLQLIFWVDLMTVNLGNLPRWVKRASPLKNWHNCFASTRIECSSLRSIVYAFASVTLPKIKRACIISDRSVFSPMAPGMPSIIKLVLLWSRFTAIWAPMSSNQPFLVIMRAFLHMGRPVQEKLLLWWELQKTRV